MRAAKRRQERLQHAQLTDDVHVELTRQLLRRQELERRGDRDPGVVDKRVELVDSRGSMADPLGVGDVEDDLDRPLRRLARVPHRGEDLPPAIPQQLGRRATDPRRDPRDQDSRPSRRGRRGG